MWGTRRESTLDGSRSSVPEAWPPRSMELLEAMLRLRGVCWAHMIHLALSRESGTEDALPPGKKVGNESCRESSDLQGDSPTSASPFPASVRSVS